MTVQKQITDRNSCRNKRNEFLKVIRCSENPVDEQNRGSCAVAYPDVFPVFQIITPFVWIISKQL